MSESRYEDRTDSVAKKLELLHAAYRRGAHKLALSLLTSIKDSVTLERQQQLLPGDPVVSTDTYGEVGNLPPHWATWARPWQFYKLVQLSETVGIVRHQEPVDLLLSFDAGPVTDLRRELRVVRVDEQGTLAEVVSQVYDEVRVAGEWRCRLVFMADVAANGETDYLVLFGNPWAELPAYTTDLRVRGEGYGLDIENAYYVARLSRQMGQLERLEYKRAHRLELAVGGEGHGEPPNIDWAHDYSAAGGFLKFRVTNWAECPNYEVVRGPLCVQVRRWGFPHGPAHPLFTPSRMHIDLCYTFYAGQPYFLKHGRMEMIQDFEISYLRDDEWLFYNRPFTHLVWMDRNGTLHEGDVQKGHEDDLWGMGFFNEHSRECFIALFLDHSAENFDDIRHCGSPTVKYMGDGQLWSRWAARDEPRFKAGAVLKQHNAYLLEPYRGPEQVEETRRRMLAPLRIRAGEIAGGARVGPGPLARPGETEEAAPLKTAIWVALREARDQQFMKADANVVDMGYVYDVQVDGDLVRVLMTMPHRGRPKYGFVGNPIRECLLKLDGVREVVVECTWEPAWTVNRMTPQGQKALGLPG